MLNTNQHAGNLKLYNVAFEILQGKHVLLHIVNRHAGNLKLYNVAFEMWQGKYVSLHIANYDMISHAFWVSTSLLFGYRSTSNISRTKFQNLNVSSIVLQLYLPNPLKPGV